MKKQLILVTGVFVLISLCIASCGKKKSDGIAPTYGSTGNPNPSNPTVTGNVTPTNPATDNSAVYVGGNGWSNPTCGTTNSIALKAYNGTVDVTLAFSSAITSGTYAVGPSPAANVCALTILNPPNQPSGIVWYGRTGNIVVNTTSASINASFSGIVCTQANFNFPTVTANGFIGCAQ